MAMERENRPEMPAGTEAGRTVCDPHGCRAVKAPLLLLLLLLLGGAGTPGGDAAWRAAFPEADRIGAPEGTLPAMPNSGGCGGSFSR